MRIVNDIVDKPPADAMSHGRGKVFELLSAAAVRRRCQNVHAWVAAGRSDYFTLDESRLENVAELVAQTTLRNYPALDVPPHSRWRHFVVGGIDRWDQMTRRHPGDSLETARAAIDLATVSVLLDAGAGAGWTYHEAGTGLRFARSEGLAVASLAAFGEGKFSSDQEQLQRVDGEALAAIDANRLGGMFQVSDANPLAGLDQRAALLQRLGAALRENPQVFGAPLARPGHLVDYLLCRFPDRRVAAGDLLSILLRAYGSIWPSAIEVDGIPIGDAGRHIAAETDDLTSGIVPFHKLSQWLAYSLIEPLERAGIVVDGVSGLTGLAEYRNGGLLIDGGVIRPRSLIDPQCRHDVQSTLIVEWRALTVVLLDHLLEPVRKRLGVGEAFSMPQMLQGGSWLAGRDIALTRRPPDGPPPISIVSTGTTF